MIKWLAAVLLSLSFAFPVHAQKPDILEVVEIDGAIHAGVAEAVARRVDEINDNSKVKAVLLVLNTPGGSVTASSALYEDLSRIKVPVVAWCQALCASGGVYAMMAPSVKYIAVRSETISGSVGVVSQSIRFPRLLDFLKVDAKTYRSGHLKDAGNPLRGLEEAEDKYLQQIIDELAEKFYAIVAKGRGSKISAEAWKEIKMARIFIGADAKRVGLADAIATKAEVVAKAKELSGAKTIFTREELKKMSAAAHSDSIYSVPVKQPSMLGDLPWVIETAKEVLSGSSVKFAYMLPYQF